MNINNVIKELVHIETNDYIIRGFISAESNMSSGRVLSIVLNSDKEFIAVEKCEIQPRRPSTNKLEYVDFIQLNKSAIIIMKPLEEC